MTLPVKCHQGDVVGQYVPFYFCPRSVMLFVIHRANHAELTYRGGQGPIVHLEADLHDVIAWADANNRRWAFTLSNAGAYYTEFRSDEDQLGEINWPAVASDDFRNSEVRERKQAEFLIKSAFPWHLVQAIGVKSTDIKNQADAAIAAAAHRPPVRIAPRWYF